MGELPEEDDQEQGECLDPDRARGRGPADHRRQRPGDRADGRVERRPRLERRVNQDVEQERGEGHRRREELAPQGGSASRAAPSADAEDRGLGGIHPALGRARLAVRLIRASRARSIHWFSVLAPPATRAVPSSVNEKVAGWALSPAPSRKPTPTVTRTIATILGFVSETYAASLAPGRGEDRVGPISASPGVPNETAVFKRRPPDPPAPIRGRRIRVRESSTGRGRRTQVPERPQGQDHARGQEQGAVGLVAGPDHRLVEADRVRKAVEGKQGDEADQPQGDLEGAAKARKRAEGTRAFARPCAARRDRRRRAHEPDGDRGQGVNARASIVP